MENMDDEVPEELRREEEELKKTINACLWKAGYNGYEINTLYHTWPEDGRQILALLTGGYESRKDAKPTRRSASQAVLLHVVSANCESQYLYREL